MGCARCARFGVAVLCCVVVYGVVWVSAPHPASFSVPLRPAGPRYSAWEQRLAEDEATLKQRADDYHKHTTTVDEQLQKRETALAQREKAVVEAEARTRREATLAAERATAAGENEAAARRAKQEAEALLRSAKLKDAELTTARQQAKLLEEKASKRAADIEEEWKTVRAERVRGVHGARRSN